MSEGIKQIKRTDGWVRKLLTKYYYSYLSHTFSVIPENVHRRLRNMARNHVSLIVKGKSPQDCRAMLELLINQGIPHIYGYAEEKLFYYYLIKLFYNKIS